GVLVSSSGPNKQGEATKMDPTEDSRNAPLRRLLMFSVAIEGATALVLLVVPTFVARVLLGSALAPEATAIARLCGVSLLSLVVACGAGLRREAAPSAGSLR